MATLTVGPTSTYPTISAAMAAAAAGDTVSLEAGYGGETATVTQTGMTVTGDATSTGITLQLGPGVAGFTLGGTAPINVLDAADGDAIVGNDGDNVITVTGGVDSVSGGGGTGDRLVVDYSISAGAVTGDSTSNFTQVPGLNSVTITAGTFEHFTVSTGAGADTLTTGAGDDVINAGDGDNTITAGAGNNHVTGGNDADVITTLGGDDVIDGGDGANTIIAGQGANTITGGNDADTITALDGGNVINAGNGFNNVTSGGGADIISGGLGTDVIEAGGGDDVVTVNGGADTVHAGSGTDRLVVDYAALSAAVTLTNFTGGAGDINGPAGNSVNFDGVENLSITTGSGNDDINTGDGVDVLNSGAGNDLLNGGGGADELDGGADTDELAGGAGNDKLDGGTGSDTAVYSGAQSDYTVTYLSPTQLQVVDNRPLGPDGTDILTGVEFLRFSDVTTAVEFPNFVPVITSNGGLATAAISVAENTLAVTTVTATDPDLETPTYSLVGGADQARFSINATTGALAFAAAPDFENPTDVGANNVYDVVVRASDGNGGQDDQAIAVTVTNAADTPALIDSFTMAENSTNAGTVAYQDVNGQPVAYSIAAGLDGAHFAIDATSGALRFLKGPDFEEQTDGDGNNVYDVNVTGTLGSSVETHVIHVSVSNVDGNGINGTKHKDVVTSHKTVSGELEATGEEDTIMGRKGNDKLSGLDGNDTIDGGKNNDKLKGNEGDDLLIGGKGRDKLVGHDGDDTLLGGGGKDKLKGNDGHDELFGGGKSDRLLGQAGDDFLFGARGNDTLIGGKGVDTFFFKGSLKHTDTVKDFGAGDMIVLDHDTFGSVGAGPLSQADFDEYFNYKNGKLAYDDDGSGGGKAVVFATFANKADIEASDIMLV